MTKLMNYVLVLGATISLLPNQAQAAGQYNATKDKASASDELFMQGATSTNLLEIKLGKLAARRSQSKAVKAFASQMVKDHNNAQHALAGIAQSLGVTLPSNLDAAGQKEFDKLRKLNGKAFDLEYMSFNVPAHATTLASMESEKGRIINTKLKDWDINTLKTVKLHLSMAKVDDRQVADAEHKTATGRNGNRY